MFGDIQESGYNVSRGRLVVPEYIGSFDFMSPEYDSVWPAKSHNVENSVDRENAGARWSYKILASDLNAGQAVI